MSKENKFGIINPKKVDTTGRELNYGDIVMVFNGDGDPAADKKWSIEKVVCKDGDMMTVFPSLIFDIYTSVEKKRPEWLVIIKSCDQRFVRDHSIFGYKDKDGRIYEGQE